MNRGERIRPNTGAWFEHNYQQILRRDDKFREKVVANSNFDDFDKQVVESAYRHDADFAADGKYFNALSKAFVGQSLDEDELFSIGVDISSDILSDGMQPEDIITGYLCAINNIDNLRLGLVGDRSHGTLMGLRDYIRLGVVGTLANDQSSDDVFTRIDESLVKTSEVKCSLNEKALGHLAHLGVKLSQYTEIRAVAETYNKETLSDDEYAHLTQKALRLSAEAMSHRKYGTKPAYIEATIGGSWVYYDADDWAKRFPGKNNAASRYSDVAAIVCHTPSTGLKDLRISFKFEPYLATFSSSFDIDLTLYIDKSGALTLDPDGLTDIGLDLGITHEQELALRAEVASNFFDLSMPVDQSGINAKKPNSFPGTKRKNLDPIRDLLVPRVRYMESISQHIDSDDIVRTVREHDVTWFVRILPDGWHASPEAQVEAEEHGIVLAENETFVREHTRGQGNRVLGYHAVRRTKTSR